MPIKNIAIKIALVTGALLLFDLVTSYFFIYEAWYWLGILASGVVIGYFFDKLPDM